MRNFLISTIIFLLSSLICSGQTDNDCKKLLKKDITFESLQDPSEFLKDFQMLIECEFEPIDYHIILGPKKDLNMIEVLLLSSNKKSITFKQLKIFIQEFKKFPEYAALRDLVESTVLFMSKQVTLKEWKADSLMLVKMNFQPGSIVTISELVKQNGDENLTYEELLTSNADKITQKVEITPVITYTDKAELPEGMVSFVKGIPAYDNYDLARQKSRETNKPLLVYFTAYCSLNSREMENKVLMKPEIQNLLNSNFILVTLYVDDVTSLPEDQTYFSEILKKKIMTEGQKAAELQIRDFNFNAQPLFVIKDSGGNELGRITLTLSEQEFKEFLAREGKSILEDKN